MNAEKKANTEEKSSAEEKAINEYEPIGDPIKDYGLGYRHFQVFLAFAMVSTAYIVRTSVSVSIIAMTGDSRNVTDWEIYDWDKQTQDYILGSFFWGYMLMQIPSGYLAHKIGGKILLVCAMVSNGLIFVILPFAIRLGGWKAAFMLRVFQGLTQSCTFPSVHTLLGKWAPVEERSRLGNFVISGGPFGTIIGMPLSGYLCEHYGWPVTFQVIGAVAITMGFCMLWLGSDSPAKHPKISNEERFYIQNSLGQTSKSKHSSTPWKSIAMCVPFWALLCTHIGANWSYLIMLLEIPSYLKMALGINMQQSSLYSALPFIAMWCLGMVISIISDSLINKKILTITGARKLANCIGMWGSSLCLILLTFVPTTDFTVILIFLALSTGLIASCNVGSTLNPIDLSPNFAGLLLAIANSISNGIGILAPISVGMILQDTSDASQWRKVFFLTAFISSVMNVGFVIFGSSEKQPWDEPESFDDIEMSDKKLKDKLTKK